MNICFFFIWLFYVFWGGICDWHFFLLFWHFVDQTMNHLCCHPTKYIIYSMCSVCVCQLCVAKVSHLWLFCISQVGLISVQVVVVSNDDTVEMGVLDGDARGFSWWKGRTGRRRRRRERSRGLCCPLLSTAAAAPHLICNTWTNYMFSFV